jgi:hypothetical protein
MNNNLNYNTNFYYQYVEEYLRNNISKEVTIHVSFSDSIEWRDSTFNGLLDYVGKDYIVIKSNNKKTIIWSIYIDYVVIN